LDHFKDHLRSNRVLVHHHTSHPIGFFFEQPPLYTTIVRDPVDRFISDINHCRAVLCGEWDEVHQKKLIDPKVEVEGRGWSRHLVEMAASPEISLENLLESALKEPCIARYYYWAFYHLLLGTPEAIQPALLPGDCPSNEALANLVLSKFAYVGHFPHVFKTYLKIAQSYKIPPAFAGESFPHMLQRNSNVLIPALRKDLRAAFKSEYEFLSKLGCDFS